MKKAALVLSVGALAGGIALLVWANLRPYADNQRNGAYLLGVLLLVTAVCAVLLTIPRRPRRSRSQPLPGSEDGRRGDHPPEMVSRSTSS